MRSIKLGRRQAVASASMFAAGLVAIAGFVACAAPGAGVGSSTSASTSACEDEDSLEISFAPSYSAFDGTHTFKVPAKVDGVKKAKWSVSEKGAVDFDDQGGGQTMMTINKAGTFTITAQSGSECGSTTLTVTSATPDDWESGNARYNNGVILQRGKRDGGGGGGGDAGADRSQAACTNCHGEGSKTDIEHTPMQTAGYSDQDLINIFTKAQKPPGVPQRIMKLEQWQKIHQWSMPDDALKGVVVYLRSLEPKSQGPTVDWAGGGGGHHDGGGGGHGDGTGSGSGSGSSHGDGG